MTGIVLIPVGGPTIIEIVGPPLSAAAIILAAYLAGVLTERLWRSK